MSNTTSASTSEVCAVCGDVSNGRRYGAPACLGCIVFFRRAVVNQSQFKCWKRGSCIITCASRCVCRCCRLRKCFVVGMRPEAIQRRDILGPRKPKKMVDSAEVSPLFSSRCSSSSDSSDVGDLARFDVQSLIQLQQNQRELHREFYTLKNSGDGSHSINGKLHRRARANDINLILKLGIQNANEWGAQFEPYQRLSQEDRKLVLSEFGFAFVLIDVGFKTASELRENDGGFLLLQNDVFMHSDYFLALPSEDAKKENTAQKADLHYAFVNELVKCVSTPFWKLDIDEFESAILKTILLLTPSFPGQVIYGNIDLLHTKCMAELMEHSEEKAPGRGAERFGEIILLISSIRCAIKTIYNQTRVSDVFHFMTFDASVRNIFLS